MLQGLPSSKTELVAYWDFEDGTADDGSTFSHDGTLVGDARIMADGIPWPLPLSLTWHTLQINLHGTPFTNLTVQFQSTTDLVNGAWSDMPEPLQVRGSDYHVLDVITNQPRQFYRALIRP